MPAERKLATVFGGSGFLGRYVVKRLAARGYTVRVAVRDAEAAMFLRPMGGVGQIVPLYAPLHEEALVARATEGAEVVINLIGILAERQRGDFMRTHVEGAGRIARLAGNTQARHLVHVSALGADAASRSLYASSKAAGEAAVRAAFPKAAILRPAILFGPDDHFFNRFAALAALSPILPIVGAKTRFQPVYVADVADAVLAALSAEAAGNIFELGGPEQKTLRQLIEYMLKITERKCHILDLPVSLARLQAAILQRLPGKLLTTDQVRMLQYDNVVTAGALDLSNLGIVAARMDLIVPAYLARFRQGGRRHEAGYSK